MQLHNKYNYKQIQTETKPYSWSGGKHTQTHTLKVSSSWVVQEGDKLVQKTLSALAGSRDRMSAVRCAKQALD